MKCIVIDDEPLARQGIELMIKDIPWLECCGSFPGTIEADTYLHDHPVELIFLDINMPQLTGMEYLRTVKNKARFIITTAYPEYALEGYELNVTDYLLKPIRFERFIKQ